MLVQPALNNCSKHNFKGYFHNLFSKLRKDRFEFHLISVDHLKKGDSEVE